MSYLYETHLHTTAASACAKSTGSEYISFYKELGFDGIIVTDHFFNGTSAVPVSRALLRPQKPSVGRAC